MAYLYFVGMAIYFAVHIAFVVAFIRQGTLRKSILETQESFLSFHILIGIMSSCVWPLSLFVGLLYWLSLMLSKVLVKFIKD